MSALKVSEADVMKFYNEMMALNSEKEQRGVLKTFLLSSGTHSTQFAVFECVFVARGSRP